jgi:hypothetical protein
MTKRNKEIIAVISTLIVLAVAGYIFLTEKPAGRPDSTTAENARPAVPGPKEITIRNVTREAIQYSLKLNGSTAKPAEKRLAVGAVDRIPATQTMEITYKKWGRDVVYSLTPGRPYSFRYDSDNNIDIWLGSHGMEDAEDLAPFVPTPMEVVEKMLELAKVTKNDVVYDIGCGDGRSVIFSAKKAGVEKLVKFRLEDATKTDISDATVVTIYLLPESNELLRPKFEKELKPGTPVVSHNYIIPGWEDKEAGFLSIKDQDGTEHSIFLYRR